MVTNVTAFGAFVDVGVHQDGLVHVSELAHRFVKDPAEVVKVGDRVRGAGAQGRRASAQRIGLSDQAGERARRRRRDRRRERRAAGRAMGRSRRMGRSESPKPPPAKGRRPKRPPFNNPFAAAFGKK